MVNQTNAREPIAIVGIGCRLPGRVATPAELWRALAGGVDAIREVPADRWDAALWVDADAQAPGKMATGWGGFLDDVAGFDAEFFGVSPAEARQMDPQQRLALEVAWAAVEDARMIPGSLAGSRTGVYLGAMWQDYPLVAGGDPEAIRVHSATGWDTSVISARIAYALGLRGPALTVGTASSSSLVAVHLAVQSLRSGETDVALAGGVNLMLHPHSSVAMTKLGTQSPDGRCRAFDADGDGYVRGEGCGVVVLRRLSDALAAGDRIYAVVNGSAVNNDGATAGLTEPSAEAQAQVLRAAWADAGVSPREAAYSEAHGTGTRLGDVIEATALGSVFGDGRTAPLLIGSAKTNFGHLEAAAGILGLLKAALAIHHGRIPPSLHFQTPNPNIDFDAHHLRVAATGEPWPDGPRFAGVSSFGFGGTNAHVALGQASPAQQAVPGAGSEPRSEPGPIYEAPVCLVVSGKTERALAGNAARLADHLRNWPDGDLVDVAYSLATTRTHFGDRGVVVGSSVGEVIKLIDDIGLTIGSVGERGRVVFVFPGQGAQWWGMGRELLRESEVFRETLTECDRALFPHLGWSVVELLSGEEVEPSSWGRVDVVQPVLFAVYVGLAAVWRSWGVEPGAVVGHSQGEVAAAVVCGALSVEDGARVVALRSRAIGESGLGGAMAVVERPVGEVEEWLGSYDGSLSVAVVNSARSTVVAGDAGAVERFVAQMAEMEVFCRRVDVDYASHSAQMDVVLPGLLKDLAGLRPRVGQVDFYSSVTGGVVSGSELDGGYWCRNLREAVRFDRVVEGLRGDGFGVFVEVSPHPVLGVVLADVGGVSVGSLKRDRGGVAELLRALGELHVQGVAVDWERVFAGRGASRVDVPTYGFQRQRHWLGENDDVPVADDDSWRAQVAALSETERLPWLTDFVVRQATAVLGRSEGSVRPDVVLREQGFDSLTVVELRNRLVARTAAALPSTLAYDYPTPRAIAGLLLERAAAQPAAAVLPRAVPTAVPKAAPKLPPSDDAVAIVAMGCRLPGGIDTPEAFWELLSEGREAIGPFPARWDQWGPDGKPLVGEGGFLHDAELFDASFFGLSPRQAQSMDPQQRIVLEVVWEALERANIRPETLAGTRTGIYLGAMSSDYDVARRWDADAIDGNQLTGNASSVISGRVAYTLGLEGPALTVDTACSSSLVALHLASAALRSGECDVALAGGVTVMSTPQMFVEFGRLEGLAQDGRCKSFSDHADGTSWSEGCGILVLKRLSAAERDGDRVLAVVRGTAINQDGRSQGLTAPNGLAQQRVLRDALAAARLTPADIDAVEAHGTGTVLGDPIEAGALAEVFSGIGQPVYLGSSKSNLGHAQAAAGVIGVMKMVLALQHELLPETLRADPPTTHVDWESSPLELLLESRSWRRAARVRRAGVSSFGMSGTNAHAIIEEAPAAETVETAESAASAPDAAGYPLLISAHDEPALRAQADRWARWLAERPSASLRDIARTAAESRTHFGVRGVVVGGSVNEVAEGLTSDGLAIGSVGERGRVVFVFPGQGAQWWGMGRALLRESEVFREAVAECDRALMPFLGWSALDLLSSDGDEDVSWGRVDVVQPVLFAVYVGLAAVWRSWGVVPGAVVGHSQGEVAAAVVCGALSVEDGARVVALRSRAVREHGLGGAMAVVERPVDEVREWLGSYDGTLSVAVVNSARSTVVAGDAGAVERFVAQMTEMEVFCRQVEVDYASHSAEMDRVLPELRDSLAGLRPRVGQVDFYSSVTGEALSGSELDGGYWCRNLREAVRFDRVVEQLRGDGFGVFVEVSPHPVLGVVLADVGGVSVGSLKRDRGGVAELLRALGELHVQGVPVDWERVFAGRGASRVDVPTYGFQRQRHWLDRPEPRPALTAAGQLPAGHPWLGTMMTLAGSPGSYLFSGRLSLAEHPWLADHAVSGRVFVPGAGMLDMALSVARSVGASAVAELTLLEPLVLTESAALRLQVTVGDCDARGRRPFTLHSQPEGATEPPAREWRQHAAGELADAPAPEPEPEPFETLRQWPVPGAQAVDISDFYSRTRTMGLAYGPAFQGLQEFARQGTTAVYGRVRLPESLNPAGYSLHPALLDATLHVIVADLLESSTDTRPPLPFIWSDVQLYRAPGTELRVRAEIADNARATLWLADLDGAPVARIGGLQLQRADLGRSSLVDHLYRVDFEAAPLTRENAKLANTVVLGDATLADALGAAAMPDVDAFFDKLDAGAEPPEHLILTTLDDAAQALRSLQRWLAEPRLRETQLTWLTRDAVSSGPDDHVPNWPNAALWGLARSTRTEQPERTLRLVDLDSAAPDPELLARILVHPGEPEWVVRGETALVPRARQVDTRDDALTVPNDGAGGWHLHVQERGRLDAITVVPDEDDGPLAAGQVRVEIRVAGVNFRDVLNALDVVPAPRLGLECAGVVREIGAGVENVRPGDRVMGLAMGTFGAAARMEAAKLVRIPDALTFAEAATIPVAFVTALYALDDLAALQPGERVLVHAAAGGVGIAAVGLARLRGAEVFATASPGKWPALRALGLDDAHIRSSRDTGFEAAWLRETDGRGMDVVLNSLAGEFIDASLRLLPRGGRFLELGKTDPRSPVRIAEDHPGVEYRGYDVTVDIAPERISAMLSETADLLACGELSPLPYSAYDVRHTPHALRHMQQAKHVGKLVVTMPRALDPDGTVLITGGLGELGAALAAHLVREHGVRRLVLCSRRGADPRAAELVRELEAAGAEQVRVVACDVAERADVAAVLADVDPEHPWTAVFHLAGVLDDGLVPGFTEERLRRVMAPKVLGARHLDELTQRLDLAAFVLFSSIAGTLGTAGQSGYAAANATLDALAARRRKQGLPAVSLAFGLWEQAGVGMTAHLSRAELGRLRRQGIGSLSPDEGLRALDHALTRPEPYLAPAHLELASLRHALGDAEPPAVLRALIGPRAQPAAVPAQEPPLTERMAAMPEAERLAALIDVVRDEVAAVLGLSGREGVAQDRALRSLGIDSLTMIELRKRLSRRANVKLPATLVFDYPTAEAIAGLLLRDGLGQ